MEGSLRAIGRLAGGLGSVAVMGLMVSCSRFEESGLPGSASSMARNQMMFIREEPSTFGFYRLTSLSKIYPDLAFFVQKKGKPDFIAETTNRGQNYFILYYLEKRQAFACRTRPGQRGLIEFSGPYPITDKEYRTLDGFRTGETP
jgi:hypothetical protein